MTRVTRKKHFDIEKTQTTDKNKQSREAAEESPQCTWVRQTSGVM